MKDDIGKINESLAKALCHNLTVLIKEAYVNGIDLEFDDAAHLFPRLHTKSRKMAT